MIIPLLCYRVASLCAASLQLFAELLERKICLQLHAHLRGGTASREGWKAKKKKKKDKVSPRPNPNPILLFGPPFSVCMSRWSPCLSVWRGSLRLAGALQQFSVYVYVCACMCAHMFVYKRLSGPTDSIKWNSSCAHYMTLFLWIIYLCMLISTSSLLLKCIIIPCSTWKCVWIKGYFLPRGYQKLCCTGYSVILCLHAFSISISVCTFLILSYRAKCFHSVFSFLVVLFAVEFSYHSGHKKA